MTDTRYSAEELRKEITHWGLSAESRLASMLRQAARDAETLAGIRAFILKYSHPDEFDKHAIAYGKAVLAELDRLSRGDA